MREEYVTLTFVGLGFLIAGLIYVIPSVVAFYRSHPNRWVILVINLAFGGTVVGWGLALVWALKAVHRPGSVSSGGESGLNLFVDDVHKVQVVEPPPIPPSSASQELERLHNLLVQGAISQTEFNDLKGKLLRPA